jgi:hypothetical protein
MEIKKVPINGPMNDLMNSLLSLMVSDLYKAYAKKINRDVMKIVSNVQNSGVVKRFTNRTS